MALFKILRGSSTGLKDLPINDGWCYFTPDTGLFYIDYNETRVPLNAKDAQTLSGASLVQVLNSEGLDQEILSAAAVNEIKNNLELLIAAKQERITGTEGQAVVIGANGNPTVVNTSLFTSGGIINQNTGEIIKIWRGTKVEYDALETKSNDTMYIITDAQFKPEGKSYLTFSSPNSFTLKVNNTTKYWDGILEYFSSNRTWTIWDGATTLSSIDNDGENVLYLRGTGNTVITGNNQNYRWVLTGSDIACIGNIENLLDYSTVESGNHPTMSDYCYFYMFSGCTSLIQAPDLPATALASNCYDHMFYNCRSLTQAPALPATTLASYCYDCMFSGCRSLIQAPALPATTLADWCYNSMFYRCTSLIQAPALPATTMKSGCYQSMFANCTSLTQAPALPATMIADYCYLDMFDNCTALTQVPALPATTLAAGCYYNMFRGCTSITKLPALPATTLAGQCYTSMFQGCTSLKLSSSKTEEYTQEYRIPSSGEGTTAINALNDMFVSTGGTFTGTPEINTTYYLSSDNMIVRDTEIATLNGYVGSMIDGKVPTISSIAITTPPSKTTYTAGETFDPAGMVVQATYSNGATLQATGYAYSPSTALTYGTTKVTIVYTEGGVTKTTTLSVTVERKSIATVPRQSGTLTYTGSAQSPSWSNYNAEQLTIGGVTSGTNAGSYNATFTPTANYCWSDGSTMAKTVAWSIGKAAGSLSLSKTSITLNSSTKSTTFTVTRAGDGAISAVSSDTSVATVSVSGTTVTVNSVNDKVGTATITVSVATGTNHTAPSNKTCAVSCKFLPAIGTALNDISWADIRKISDAGLASSYFAVGDRKAVALSGTAGSLSLSGTYYCYIIGINHNSAKEGTNRIHFQFGYTAASGGVHIAFIDDGHDSGYTSGSYFNMNNERSNSGGWANSRMRTTIIPTFKACLPSDLQSVLKTVTKYSDNTGGGSDTASYVTATTDDIFLLAEWEVFGVKKYANSAEQNYQAQYAYYSSGNSKVRYQHSSTDSTATWWLRSVQQKQSGSFCNVNTVGYVTAGYATYSRGFAPAFCV